MRAIEVINEGESPETLARTLRVNRSSVYRWLKLAEKKDGLIAKPHSGPAPRLSSVQLQELEALMLQGAQAHGWLNQLWTCARVRELIRRRFGVSLHHDHIGRILRARLNWTPQKPRRRARERDENAIAHWKQNIFPTIAQSARNRDAYLVFLDESGYMLTPTVRRTWAPRGSKPVHDGWDRRDRLSAISCITVSPKACRSNLYFRLLPHTVHGEDTVEFLRELKRTLRAPMTVLWDGGSVHSKCRVVKAFMAEQSDIIAETLPAYAPELNPDELVWGWSKYGRLANLAADNTDQLAENVIDELLYLKQQPHLLASFIRKTELPLAA